MLTASSDFGIGTDGALLTRLSSGGPLSITITFEDGSKVSAPLLDEIPGEDFGSFVDIAIADAAQPSGGDTDGDGDVDGDDLLNTLLGFGTRFGALPLDGDADGQGDVDRADVEILLAALVPAAGNVVATSTVPEPHAALLLTVSCLAGLVLVRRSRAVRS